MFVGVPPRDVLQAILRADSAGANLVQRRRQKLAQILSTDDLLEKEMQRRIDLGEFDLRKIIRELNNSNEKGDTAGIDDARSHLKK
eukprot:3764697-Karenia_brevis.AAC.1